MMAHVSWLPGTPRTETDTRSSFAVVNGRMLDRHWPGGAGTYAPDVPRERLRGGPGPAYEPAKRCLDIVGSLLLLLLACPILLVIAAIVKATSRGPVVFRQNRLGRYGREFPCLKFRTMVPDAEKILAERADLREQFQASYKLKDDPRVTRVGAFLRRTSLDEVPQLLNVLRGEMSLVGPRPIIPPEIEKYGRYGPTLLTVKPGLGGLWQVAGRSDTTYEERVSLDVEYVRSRSMALDLQLLLQTSVSVLLRRGAC